MMDIKTEVLDIAEEDNEAYDIIYQKHPIATSIVNIDSEHVFETSESKMYTPLGTMNLDRLRISGRLSTPLIKCIPTSPEKNCSKNNNKDCQSPKKLGTTTIGRSHYGRLRSPNKSESGCMNGRSERLDTNEEIVRDMTQLTGRYNNENDNESEDDMFAESQKHGDSNEIMTNRNVATDFQQLTPVKAMKEKLKNSSIEDELLFTTPKSVGKRSMSSDSEFERVCDSIKNNKFDPGQFTFETMDLLDEFDDFDDVANDKILSDMLGLANVNEVEKDEPQTDPLAISPHKKEDPEQLNDAVSLKKKDEQNLSNEIIRRSSRLLEKLKKQSDIDDDSANPQLRKLREEINLVDKKEAISSAAIKRLRNLQVKLDYEPVPQHQLETAVSRPPTRAIKKLFVEYGPLKKGHYLKSEDNTIAENWNRFCQIHDWDPEMLTPFFHGRIRRKGIINNSQRIKFAQFLAKGLAWRSLYSVFARFQAIFSRRKHKRMFTKEEDERILTYIDNEKRHSLKCERLSKLLGRSKPSIWGRYSRLTRQSNTNSKIRTQIEWDIPLTEKFLKNLLDVTMSQNIYELKDAIIPTVVWKKLEKKLKISHETMMYYWLSQLHPQLFSTRTIYENDIKIMLIEYMYVKGIAHRREIIWTTVAQYFDGFTSSHLCRMFYTMVNGSPLKSKRNLAEVIGWLYEKRIPQLTTKIKDRYLPRLIYKKGRIEIIKEFSSSSSSSYSSESD